MKYHADSFHETDLQEHLKAMHVKKLVIVGIQTEFCVDTTCRRAFSLGYETILVADGHSTFDSDLLTASQIIAHHNMVLGSQFAELKQAADVEF